MIRFSAVNRTKYMVAIPVLICMGLLIAMCVSVSAASILKAHSQSAFMAPRTTDSSSLSTPDAHSPSVQSRLRNSRELSYEEAAPLIQQLLPAASHQPEDISPGVPYVKTFLKSKTCNGPHITADLSVFSGHYNSCVLYPGFDGSQELNTCSVEIGGTASFEWSSFSNYKCIQDMTFSTWFANNSAVRSDGCFEVLLIFPDDHIFLSAIASCPQALASPIATSPVVGLEFVESMLSKSSPMSSEKALHQLQELLPAAVRSHEHTPLASPFITLFPHSTTCGGMSVTTDLSEFEGKYNVCIGDGVSQLLSICSVQKSGAASFLWAEFDEPGCHEDDLAGALHAMNQSVDASGCFEIDLLTFMGHYTMSAEVVCPGESRLPASSSPGVGLKRVESMLNKSTPMSSEKAFHQLQKLLRPHEHTPLESPFITLFPHTTTCEGKSITADLSEFEHMYNVCLGDEESQLLSVCSVHDSEAASFVWEEFDEPGCHEDDWANGLHALDADVDSHGCFEIDFVTPEGQITMSAQMVCPAEAKSSYRVLPFASH